MGTAHLSARSDQFPRWVEDPTRSTSSIRGMDVAAMFGSSTARFRKVSMSNTSNDRHLYPSRLGAIRLTEWAYFYSALFLFCIRFLASPHFCLQSTKSNST